MPPPPDKVLPLFLNPAKYSLYVDLCLFHFRKLMKSAKIEVSYFAAGIVAHLASDSLDSWNLTTIPKKEIANELSGIVSLWKTPENEMVAYRSFTPFFPLMAENQEYAVQLWAVWAIHHVCSKNPMRYCPMLVYEEGIRYVLMLIEALVKYDQVMYTQTYNINLCIIFLC